MHPQGVRVLRRVDTWLWIDSWNRPSVQLCHVTWDELQESIGAKVDRDYTVPLQSFHFNRLRVWSACELANKWKYFRIQYISIFLCCWAIARIGFMQIHNSKLQLILSLSNSVDMHYIQHIQIHFQPNQNIIGYLLWYVMISIHLPSLLSALALVDIRPLSSINFYETYIK